MDSIVDLLAQIKRRPGMYIGKRSAIRLHVFLQGWLLGKGAAPDHEVLREFQGWIASRYKVSSNHSWAEIITFYSEGNIEAFENFYSSFDEFMSRGDE